MANAKGCVHNHELSGYGQKQSLNFARPPSGEGCITNEKIMKLWMILAATVLALSACASQPPKTLNQKLAEAADTADRKETLRLACLSEAEWPASLQKVRAINSYGVQQQRHRLTQLPEIKKMKSLCRRMDDLTTTDAEEKLLSRELANICAAKVAEKKQKKGEGWAEHANRIADICKEMTGQKL